MKALALAILALLASPAFAETPVTLELTGIGGNDGQLVVRVYDSKKSWLKDAAHETTVEAEGVSEDGTLTVSMMLPPGEYAVHVYHDLDANGKMKSNFVGIPKEPTGVSRDAKGKFGPPKFKDAMFVVRDEAMSMTINIVSI